MRKLLALKTVLVIALLYGLSKTEYAAADPDLMFWGTVFGLAALLIMNVAYYIYRRRFPREGE